jgi:hypothetical protein
LIIWAFCLFAGRGTSPLAPASPLSTMEDLPQRDARGEIDEPTFIRMQATLQQSDPQP